MFEKLTDTNERGQVGIETLVIFIAMVLVAAIAAGVLINTAGFLQNRASATSQDSTAQVSDQVIVISATGDVGANGQNISDVNFTVMESPGASDIDLSAATVEWTGPDGHTTLLYNSSGANATNEYFGVSAVKDSDGSKPVINSKDDRMSVNVQLSDSVGPNDPLKNLTGGQEVTVKFVTQAGSIYTYVVNVPESLSSAKGSAVSV